MAAKHTPGPWDTLDSALGIQVVAKGEDEEPVALAIVRSWCGQPVAEEITPNARLMAAAPELLAALEAFVSANERHGYEFDSNEPETYRLIKDAIAKAKGE